MTATTDMYTLLRAFVDELARCGMRAACTSPGSRSAPLVLSLARDPRVRCFSHIDERCAGFFALGLAKASGLPVAVACTSGTAACELLAAAVEAREARVPLLLLTADRPAELRENGAGQAIDQLELFGGAAKWFVEVGVHEADPERLRWMRTLACRAYWTALEGSPGVVHLNFPLREPLVSEDELPQDTTGRRDGVPYVRRTPTAAGAAGARGIGGLGAGEPSAAQPDAALQELVSGARRGVLVAGRDERQRGLARAAAAFAASVGWPLLADPLSGSRRGEAAIAHYDALLRDAAFVAAVEPDLVVRVGDLPVSKPLRAWLGGLDGVRQVALDLEGAWQDPASVLSDAIALDPTSTLSELTRAHAAGASPPAAAQGDWLASWRSADERAAEAILGVLAGEQLSEPAVAAELGVLLPARATLFVASSMPVRDIETFWPVRSDPPRVLCNRGANGIDGTVSAAFGAAADTPSPTGAADPVVLLIGDVALAHDIGGLLAATRLSLKLTIVLLDNGGGGIFDFLAVSGASMALASDAEPRGARRGSAYEREQEEHELEQAGEDKEREDIYTRHIATPTGLDFAKAADLYGLAYERAQTISDLRAALERALSPQVGSAIVHVRSDRTHNVELHRRVWSAVSRATAID